MAKPIKVEFKLTRITYLDFSIAVVEDLVKAKVPVNKLEKNPNVNDVKYSNDAQFDFLIDKKKVVVRLATWGDYVPEGAPAASLLSSTVLFEFEIINFDEVVDVKKATKNKKSDIKLKNNLLPLLYGMAYSTMRGMISVKFAGTFMHRAILPVVNPVKVVEESVYREPK